MLYSEIFQWLPLASIIDDQIYVVHGGISDTTELKELVLVKREKYASILKPPFFEEDSDGSDVDLQDKVLKFDEFNEWKQVRV